MFSWYRRDFFLGKKGGGGRYKMMMRRKIGWNSFALYGPSSPR
jgi:hypothetical protein